MTIYMKFWGMDLVNINLPKDIEMALSPSSIEFLRRSGLPSPERIYNERKNYLKFTSPFPELTLSKVNAEGSIKSVCPYFEFAPSLLERFDFQGHNFIRIGIEGDRDIAIDVNSGFIHYIARNQPEHWPADFPPFVQNLFVNSSVKNLGMFLTAEFIARRERIKPGKKYVDGINSDNTELREEAEEEINQIINNLENEFRVLDKGALLAPESYWRDYLTDTRML